MDIVDTFLDALQNKINASSGQITDFEEKKNQVLEIKNIFYAHNILKDEIDEKDLISFTSDEINHLFAILDNDKRELLFKTYTIYKPLVLTYEKIKANFNGDFEAPQYVEAIKWLQDMAKKISNILKIGTEPNEEYIGDLKEDSSYYNDFYNMFSGNALVKPISDFKEFNNLLDKLNFNDEEKYQIKKFVGISNIKLLKESYKTSDDSVFDKYQVIYKAKKEKYEDILLLLEGKDLSKNNHDNLMNELHINEYDLNQAICVKLFENIFNKVNKKLLTVNEAVVALEKALDISKEVEPPIVEETHAQEEVTAEEVKEEVVLPEVAYEEDENTDDEYVVEAKEILRSEKELINSVDENEFAKYLAQSLTEETVESIKYQIVSILISLHTEVEKYDNVKELDHARKMVVINIRDYIDAYKTLKEKYNKLNN